MARGDRAALGEFYEQWFDWAFGLARSLTRRDESFCLDVVQEAMLRVVRRVRAMGSEADLARWLTRVVHTVALDLLRQESRRAAREGRRRPGAAPGTSPELAERIAWLRARLANLPAPDGWLVWLRLARGATLDQAGQAAGLTGDAAHGRIRRAVSRLREAGKGERDE
jgi:RNA polymerase sigma factor (sigma-70 family)